MRVDQVPRQALQDWKEYFREAAIATTSSASSAGPGPAIAAPAPPPVFFVNGSTGAGTAPLKAAALAAGQAINEKRARLGIAKRPVRVMVLGFPNVGPYIRPPACRTS